MNNEKKAGRFEVKLRNRQENEAKPLFTANWGVIFEQEGMQSIQVEGNGWDFRFDVEADAVGNHIVKRSQLLGELQGEFIGAGTFGEVKGFSYGKDFAKCEKYNCVITRKTDNTQWVVEGAFDFGPDLYKSDPKK